MRSGNFLALAIATAGSTPQPRVIGGTPVEEFEYSFLVRLYPAGIGSYSGFCGASVLTDQWLITAAHCIGDRAATSISAGIHRHSIWSGSTDEHPCAENIGVAEKQCHPSYENDSVYLGFDICLLRLERAITCSSVVKVSLDDGTVWPIENAAPYGGGSAMVAGWGSTESYGSPQSMEPLKAQVKLYTQAQCQSFFSEPPVVRATAKSESNLLGWNCLVATSHERTGCGICPCRCARCCTRAHRSSHVMLVGTTLTNAAHAARVACAVGFSSAVSTIGGQHAMRWRTYVISH